MGRRHFDDNLCRLSVEVAAIATEYERRSREGGQGVKDRLDEILEVVRLHNDANLLSKTRGSWFLIRKGRCADGIDVHGKGS